jgi:flavodoxin I
MAKIGLFYGSTSGTTEELAEKIQEAIGDDICDVYSMEEDFDEVDDLLQYDYLILGCSTWGAGEVQNDWREPLFDMEVDKPDFSGKTIALFGPGDCEGHSKHFVGALGTFYDLFKVPGSQRRRRRLHRRLHLRKIHLHPRRQVCRVSPRRSQRKRQNRPAHRRLAGAAEA